MVREELSRFGLLTKGANIAVARDESLKLALITLS